MTAAIRLLDEQTINQIAAGEVIENPSSVVKELVENSLDAGADAITVEIRSGGRQLIRITDNGIGMTGEDAKLCLERHATSKIREIDDIHALHTMGFRGEALPSIASISKMTIVTRHREEEKGSLVQIEGGRIVQHSPAERDSGTTIEVCSLFYNVPVRKKFQRSPANDANEVHKAICSLALANPSIKFTLISQGKSLLKTTVSNEKSFQGQLKERITEVLGKEFVIGLCPLEMRHGETVLQGFIGLPPFNRHNRTGQHLLINGRVVFSPLISYAVKEGYGTAINANRHPVFVLHLTLPGDEVDVNVHPQKKEVRLRHSLPLKDLIINAVEKSLSQEELEETTTPIGFSSRPSFSYDPQPEKFIPSIDWMLKETPSINEKMETATLFKPEPVKETAKVIATIPGYLLMQSGDGTFKWMNQRAAHARILFELLDTQHLPALPIQQLLIPLTIDLPPTEAAAIQTQLDVLEKWGLGIREFGPHSFSIDAIPQLWEENEIERLLHEIAEETGSLSRPDNKKLIQRVVRSALSTRKRLSHNEAQNLINQLVKCRSPDFCPFGKPTMVEIKQEEIAKLFET
jgi:DNA mismatch repair protein MutL